MGNDKNLEMLNETEFELIKSILGEVPTEPFAKIVAIAKAVNDSGIDKDRLTDVFYEVCKRL